MPFLLAVNWGPIGTWAGAGATVLVVIVTALVALGYFDSLHGPRIHITFGATEPWCRRGRLSDGTTGLWIRIGIENTGAMPARGCIGRLITVSTDGAARRDVDPVQLRWAGMPRSRAFDPMDLRLGQREYLNVLCLRTRPDARWELVTFDDPDFDPGFVTELPLEQPHTLQISVFADNAPTATCSLIADARNGTDHLRLEVQ
jgi:hypothetical protein